ncbi:MAG: hypothetical protein PHN90_12595 [Methanothrix sp.]|nr:hypothetical protein [Methanothrix sp.]
MSGMSEDGTDQYFDKGPGGTGTDAVSGLALLSLLVNLDSGVDVLAAVSASSAVRYSGWIIMAVAGLVPVPLLFTTNDNEGRL